MIEDRLRVLEVPDRHGAMDRAVVAAEAALRRRRSRARIRRTRFGAVATLLAAAVVVSPVGAVLSGAVQDLEAVGDKPSQEASVDQPGGATSTRNEVRSVATTPDGEPVELATTTSDGLTCAYLSYPSLADRGPKTLSCLTRAVQRALSREPIGRLSLGRLATDRNALAATAFAAPDVEQIRATYEDSRGATHELPVSTAPLPPAGGLEQGQYVVAFFSPRQAASLEVEANIQLRGRSGGSGSPFVRNYEPPAWARTIERVQGRPGFRLPGELYVPAE